MTRTITEMHEATRKLVCERPQRAEQDVVATIAATLTKAERSTLVDAVLQDWCWRTRREEVLAVERDVQRERFAREDADRMRQHADLSRKTVAQFQELFDDPGRMYHSGPYDPSTPPSICLGKRGDREQFRSWCGDRFTDWYVRAAQLAHEAGPKEAELFAEDWHPRGVRARQREVLAAEISHLVAKVADEIRLELTEELLNAEFALGDGRRVRWGAASVADHEQRIALLERNAVANTEAAARHQAAIDMLKTSGVDSLSEIRASA